MPFMRADVEEYDALVNSFNDEGLPPDWLGERPSGEFEYYEGDPARFVPDDLGSVSQVVLQALIAAGATGLRVRYDGGNDEGFADPEALLFGTDSRPADDVLVELATAELVARIRGATGSSSFWGDTAGMYAKASPAGAVGHALVELSTELATRLLGESFGTGAYELYGAFTADFKTGSLMDDPNAAKPEHRE